MPAPDPQTTRRFRLTLRQELLGIFTAVLLALMVMLVLFLDERIRTSAIEAQGRQSTQDAVFFAAMLDKDIEQKLTDIKLRANNMAMLSYHTKLPEMNLSFDRIKKGNPEFEWVGFANHDGVLKASTERNKIDDRVDDQAWFQRASVDGLALLDQRAFATPEAPSRSQFPRLVDVAASARDADGKLLGVIAAHLNSEWLTSKLAFYAASRSPDNLSKPVVIDADGVLRFGLAQNLSKLDHQRLQEQIKDLDQGWFVLTPAGGEPVLYGMARHQGPKTNNNIRWITLVPMSVSAAVAEVSAIRITAFIGIGLLGTLAWLTLLMLLRRASQPIEKMIQSVRQAYDLRQPVASLQGMPLDFDSLQGTVNDFVVDLRKRESDLEKALAELKDSFTGVSESFPGVLFRFEASPNALGQFTYFSSSASHYLNLAPEAAPMSALDFFMRSEVSEPDQALADLMRQVPALERLDLMLKVQGKDSQPRDLRLIGSLRDSTRGRGVWHGVMFDVTDLLTAQRALQEADTAKSLFMATMSHEIRTPLNGVMGFAELLAQELDRPSQRADAQRIVDTAQTLTHILNDILDLAKIGEGKLILEERNFKVAEVMASCSSLFHGQAKHRGLEMTVNMQGLESLAVTSDPTRLKQVLNNLLSNALKFTSQGGIALSVSCAERTGTHATLRFAISDTGPGMSQEQVARLFQRFEQADASIFRRYGGSGLGLSIVKGIVTTMGGEILVESEPGQGTTLTVVLPLRLAPEARKHEPQDVLEAIAALDILLADDVAMNRELVIRMLKSEGHRIHEASDGQDAVDMAQRQNFDLILMDIDMPVLSGLEATRLIRSQTGPNQHRPIIALTGHAFDHDIQEAQASGFTDHLAKPIAIKALKLKIRSALRTQVPRQT